MTYDLKPFGRDYFDMTPSELFRDFGDNFLVISLMNKV